MKVNGEVSLAHLLREARGTRSKYAIERATGIAHGNLHGMENGTRFPSEATLRTLCAFYGIAFDAAVLVIARDKLERIDGSR